MLALFAAHRQIHGGEKTSKQILDTAEVTRLRKAIEEAPKTILGVSVG